MTKRSLDCGGEIALLRDKTEPAAGRRCGRTERPTERDDDACT